MTDQLRAAAQQALEAWDTRAGIDAASRAFDALRTALAQAEPVQQRIESLVQRLRAKGYEAEDAGSAVENIKDGGND